MLLSHDTHITSTWTTRPFNFFDSKKISLIFPKKNKTDILEFDIFDTNEPVPRSSSGTSGTSTVQQQYPCSFTHSRPEFWTVCCGFFRLVLCSLFVFFVRTSSYFISDARTYAHTHTPTYAHTRTRTHNTTHHNPVGFSPPAGVFPA